MRGAPLLDEALALDPGCAATHHRRGALRQAAGDLDGAGRPAPRGRLRADGP
ncbi:MAG: hypothetical protein KF878_07315 [Planctomycetes bacterium]|nr:hypothetical protein [Planctomycetota bacterium]